MYLYSFQFITLISTFMSENKDNVIFTFNVNFLHPQNKIWLTVFGESDNY